MKPVALLGVLLFMAGCWNGGNTAVSWGDVSVGQQLIDLKLALDADALTEAEYEQTKAALLSIPAICEGTADD